MMCEVRGSFFHHYPGAVTWRGSAWSEDMREIDKGTRYQRFGHDAVHSPKSAGWCGHWQRAA